VARACQNTQRPYLRRAVTALRASTATVAAYHVTPQLRTQLESSRSALRRDNLVKTGATEPSLLADLLQAQTRLMQRANGRITGQADLGLDLTQRLKSDDGPCGDVTGSRRRAHIPDQLHQLLNPRHRHDTKRAACAGAMHRPLGATARKNYQPGPVRPILALRDVGKPARAARPGHGTGQRSRRTGEPDLR
jgi:hypothetical protein